MAFWAFLKPAASAGTKAAGTVGRGGAALGRKGLQGAANAGQKTAGGAQKAAGAASRAGRGGRKVRHRPPTGRPGPRPGGRAGPGRGGSTGRPGRGAGTPGGRGRTGGRGGTGGKDGVEGGLNRAEAGRGRPKGWSRRAYDRARGRGGGLPGTGGGGGGAGEGTDGDTAGESAERARRWLRDRLRRKRRHGPFKKTRRRVSRIVTAVLLIALLLPFLAGVYGIDASGETAALMANGVTTAACPQDLAAVAERTSIPPDALAAYCAAATRFEIDWTILAGIGRMECAHGTSQLSGCRPGTANACGARGPMQFLGNTWRAGTDAVPSGQCPGIEHFTGDPIGPPIPEGQEGRGYATDGDGDGTADPWTWPDATFAAARYLLRNGLEDDERTAILAYNNSEDYVTAVLKHAGDYRAATAGMGGQSNLAVGGCPAQPQGSTAPVPASHNTTATQTMANTLIGCFGRNGHGVGCYAPRTQPDGRDGPYEHPRGRACDFMMSNGVAGGDDRSRGQAMAEYAQAHAEQLNLLYVIWYNRIWSRSRDGMTARPWSEWRDYGCGGCGPSPGHYNHVHVSVKLMPGDPPRARCVPGIPCTN